MSYQNLTLCQKATLACMLEASAPKPGNVHRGADFEDLTFFDFIQSAAAIGPVIQDRPENRLGPLVLAAIEATRSVVDSNTNLGLVLLMGPIALARSIDVDGVKEVLEDLDERDAQLVYQAISLAGAGGLGTVSKMDVHESAPESLMDAMTEAQGRDLIAAQYANGFRDVIEVAVPLFRRIQDSGLSQVEAIVRMHVELMSRYPDSLIARKCGQEVAQESADRAARVIQQAELGDEAYHAALTDFDFWLRSDGHRRNPGTTADFIGVVLFIGLIEGWLIPPSIVASEGNEDG